MIKKIVLLTLLISFAGVFSAQANQSRHGFGFSPDTGDADFDQLLIRLNNAVRDRSESFVADLSSAFQIPPQRINRFYHEYRMTPVDVLLVLQLAKTGGYPRPKILRRYQRLRAQGWRTIFIAFEIHPGSRIFLRLRRELPQVILRYVEQQPSKGSKKKKGSKKRGSKKKKGSKRK